MPCTQADSNAPLNNSLQRTVLMTMHAWPERVLTYLPVLTRSECTGYY